MNPQVSETHDKRRVPPGPIKRSAANAWRRLAGSRQGPTRVQILQRRPQKATICRLVGTGPASRPVIAKRAPVAVVAKEQLIYNEVLSTLPISALECYGSIPDDDRRFSWLFLEDAGGEPFSAQSREHRELAGRWLGLVHTCAAHIPDAAAYLPDRTGRFYRALLEAAIKSTEGILTRAALEIGCATLLTTVVSHCHQLAEEWNAVQRLWDGIPLTLLHGDLGDQNARVRGTPAGKSLVVMDWEEGGWGLLAADLAQFGGSTLEPDLTSYWSIVRGSWTGITLETVSRWADLGRLFRLIQAIGWANSGFDLSPRCQWYFDRMEWYEAKLGEWIHDVGIVT